MFRKFIIPALITIVIGVIYYYIALPPINLKSGAFWFTIILIVLLYLFSHLMLSDKHKNTSYVSAKRDNPVIGISFGKKAKVVTGTVFGIVVVVLVLIGASSSKIFNANKYQGMMTAKSADFEKDISEIPFSQIPIVDRDSAEQLGKRKIGEVVELVSQFDVTNYYTQINYNQMPVRVSPLKYSSFLKWIANRSKGIPYYVRIDMATQKTELVKLEDGMRYSPSEYFGRDLMRHVRFLHPTKLFNETSFETNDDGRPYWIISYYDYTIGILGGKDISGIVLVDAITGETTDYKVNDIPEWIDRVYSSNIVLEQANYWGAYQSGYWNSLFAQKGVVTTTDGYNYLAIDDDVWLYTGITSVVSDESNIGFLLVNMRTKQTKLYNINGAEEYSAMDSAEGKIQEKGYNATFPILINVANEPTYFISLKDQAGLVKAYSFVSVENYQIVGVADTIQGATSEYLRLLGVNPEAEKDENLNKETESTAGAVNQISSVVVNGNTVYYIKLENSDKIYKATIETGGYLPFVKSADNVNIIYYKESNTDAAITVKSINVIS